MKSIRIISIITLFTGLGIMINAASFDLPNGTPLSDALLWSVIAGIIIECQSIYIFIKNC